MNMHEVKEPKEDLQDQLNLAKEEIHSLQQQLKCLLDLTKNAWRGDQAAIVHLAELIGIDPEIEQNAFSEKKIISASSTKKTVTIADNEEILSKQTASVASSFSHDDRHERKQRQQQPQHKSAHTLAAARNSYLQPFLKQNHIDPVREQNSRQLLVNMMRYRQTEIRNPPSIPSRISSANGRPRATKHLYRFASPDNAVRHLGNPSSRTKPYFVFAGKELFQQTTNHAPVYDKGFITSNGSRHSEYSESSDDLESIPSPTEEQVITRPQTAKTMQQSSTHRYGTQSRNSENATRISSAKLTNMNERERRDAMRLQRQLNLPRQGWINQYS